MKHFFLSLPFCFSQLYEAFLPSFPQTAIEQIVTPVYPTAVLKYL